MLNERDDFFMSDEVSDPEDVWALRKRLGRPAIYDSIDDTIAREFIEKIGGFIEGVVGNERLTLGKLRELKTHSLRAGFPRTASFLTTSYLLELQEASIRKQGIRLAQTEDDIKSQELGALYIDV